MNKVGKDQLIQSVSKEYGLTQVKAKEVVESFISTIRDALVNGQEIEIRKFGTFRQHRFKNFKKRNPKTGESKTADVFRRIVFKSAKKQTHIQ